MQENNFDFEAPGFFKGKIIHRGESEIDYVIMERGHEYIQTDSLSIHEYFIVEGTGKWYYNGSIIDVSKGDRLKALVGDEYALTGEMTLYESITPPFNPEKVKTIRKPKH